MIDKNREARPAKHMENALEQAMGRIMRNAKLEADSKADVIGDRANIAVEGIADTLQRSWALPAASV